jgi:hypothetical protein
MDKDAFYFYRFGLSVQCDHHDLDLFSSIAVVDHPVEENGN